MHNGKMIIFGGILELTKELNEMLIYDFGTRCFSTIGETHNDDLNALQQSNNRMKEEDSSPLQRRGTKKGAGLGLAHQSTTSPTKLGGNSPSKLGKSPTLKLEKAKKRPPKQLTTAGGAAEPKEKRNQVLVHQCPSRCNLASSSKMLTNPLMPTTRS